MTSENQVAKKEIMKKSLLILLLISVSLFLQAQVVNGTFEAWNSTSYSEPNGWSTGNQESIPSIGVAPVTQVQGVTGSAVRMETMVISGDTAQAYIANGDPMSGTGGIPINQIPSSITGYFRYNLPNNDTALILVMFKLNGQIISSDIFKIKGTGSQNTFTSFSFPLSVPTTPDSVIVAATCSNLIDNIGVEAGSWMELDGLTFSNPTIAIPGASFENWTSESFDIAQQWETNGDAQKTTDAYQGNFAIKLTTVDYGNGNIGSASITNGHFTNNGPPSGGCPFTSMSDTLTGYYKYIANNNDSANIGINLTANGNNVGGGGINLPPVTTYTYFEMPIWSMSTPEFLAISASSSKWPYTQSSAGSTLYLDNIALKSELTLGMKNINFNRSVSVYPNPATDVLKINLNDIISGSVYVTISDVSGRVVMTEKMNSSNSQINIESLNTGIYFCNISDGTKSVQRMFAKQ